MKRVDNIFHLICSRENLERADAIARIGKTRRGEIREFDKNRDQLLEDIRQMLLSGTYHTSSYKTKEIYDPKHREICMLPYYPDRIVHQAILNVCGPIWKKVLTRDTFACIKGRGTHAARRRLKQILSRDKEGTRYCLKVDIRHFYQSIDHEKLKATVAHKIKDARTLALIGEIIDSWNPGLPLGSSPSQHLANLFLSYKIDHALKEIYHVKYMLRYMDDIVFLSSSKAELHRILEILKVQLAELGLEIKDDWAIFPVEKRGIDFLGFVFYHTHIMLRKRIKKRIFRKLAHLRKLSLTAEKIRLAVASYIGWLKYTDSIHLKHSLNTFAYAQVF